MALTTDQWSQMYADISPEARAYLAPTGVDPNVNPNAPPVLRDLSVRVANPVAAPKTAASYGVGVDQNPISNVQTPGNAPKLAVDPGPPTTPPPVSTGRPLAAPPSGGANYAVSVNQNPISNVLNPGGAPKLAVDPGPPAPIAPQTTSSNASNFSVYGNTGIKYGQGSDGQYYFNGQPISQSDYQVLYANQHGGTPPPSPTASGGAGKTGMTVTPGAPKAVDPAAGQPTSAPGSNTVNGVPLAYNVPITQPLPSGVSEPTLMPPQPGKYNTSYYKAVTDNGDFAGAVMAAPGQAVRLVDSKTGDVVYQGTGPEAARIATATANSISQSDGKKASWAIQTNNGGDNWATTASDAVDSKKHSFWGTLADIALPILGAIFLPGIGAALGLGGLTTGAAGAGILGSTAGTALGAGLGAAVGSGVSSAVQGRPLGQALEMAALSGLGAGVVGPAVGKVVGGVLSHGADIALNSGINTAIGNAAVDTISNTAIQAAASSLPATALSEVVVTALKATVPQLVANGATQAVINATAAQIANNVAAGKTPTEGVNTNPDNTVSGVVSTPTAASGAPAALGAGAGAAAGALSTPPTDVSGVVSTGAPNSQLPSEVGAALGPLVFTAAPGLGDVTLTSTPADIKDPNASKGLTPSQLAGLAKLLPLVGGAAGGGSGSGGVGGNGAAGTLASLNPMFSSALPAADNGIVGRTQTPPQGVDWKRYAIDNPEQAFFSNVKQNAPSAPGPTRAQLLAQGVSDLNHDGVIDAADLALFRRRYSAQGFAKGGRTDFAVRGAGDGRSDSIPAKLSNGEYVLDAETVSLLGNGSTDAGAKALDKFRVNVRKAKGKQLARGRFSVNAKAPEAYMSGGRV